MYHEMKKKFLSYTFIFNQIQNTNFHPGVYNFPVWICGVFSQAQNLATFLFWGRKVVPQYFQLIFGKLVHVAKHLQSINLGRILIFSNKVIDLYQFKFKGDVPPPFLKEFWNDRKLQSVKSLLMTWNHLGWKKTSFCEKFVHFATNRNLSKK